MTGRELTIQQRVENAERDLRDHSKTLTAHNDAIKMLELRTLAIEEARRARQLEEVRREEREEARDRALNVRLDGIVKDIEVVQKDVVSIKGAGAKVAWIVIAIVAGAAVTWMLKGNLLIP